MFASDSSHPRVTMNNNKTAIPFLLISLFLLVSAAAVTTGAEVKHVKDANGNPIQRQTLYFIQPASGKKEGGLVPTSIDLAHLCQLGIVQTVLPFQPGLPITFSTPFFDRGNDIWINTNLTIAFESLIWPCPSSKIWKVESSSSCTNKRYVTTGGSSSRKDSFFRIQKYGNEQNTYKLVHYQSYSAINGIKSVGTTTSFYGDPILVLNDDDDDTDAFPVKFRKVETSTDNLFQNFSLRMLLRLVFNKLYYGK